MDDINNLEIAVEEILKGDKFTRPDGVAYWTALTDGELVTSRSREPLVKVQVQFVDGGVEDRFWDPGTKLWVQRG